MSDREEREVEVLTSIADVSRFLSSCFGPNSHRKMIVTEDDRLVTQDIHRIFDTVDFDEPGVHLLVQQAAEQKEEYGDGSLATVLLAGSLADRATKLLSDGYRRATIEEGYTRAHEIARERLTEYSHTVSPSDRERLAAVARAALATDRDRMVDLVIDAATQIDEAFRAQNRASDLPDCQIRYVDNRDDAGVELVRGAVLEQDVVHPEMPRTVDDARIAILGGGKKAGSGIEEPTLFREGGSHGEGRTEVTYRPDAVSDVADLKDTERELVRRQVSRLESADVDVLFCTMGISDVGKELLRDAGIVAFRALTETNAAFLARATGGTVVMDIEDMSPDAVGRAGRVTVDTEPEQTLVRVADCPDSDVATLTVSGSLDEYRAEKERDLRASIAALLTVLDEGSVVPGGGGTEVALASDLREAARAEGGKIATPMRAFGDALEAIPRTLIENAGGDPTAAVPEMRAAEGEAQFEAHTRSVQPVGRDGPWMPEETVRATLDVATRVVTRLVRVDAVLEGAEDDDRIDISEIDPRPDPERDFDYGPLV